MHTLGFGTGPRITTLKHCNPSHREYDTPEQVSKGPDNLESVFSQSAAGSLAYNDTALNNVLSLLPTDTDAGGRASLTPQKQRQEGSVGLRGRGLGVLTLILCQ